MRVVPSFHVRLFHTGVVCYISDCSMYSTQEVFRGPDSLQPVSYGRRVLYIGLFNVFTYTDVSAFQRKLATRVAREDPFNKKKDHLLAATIDKVQSGGYKYVLLLSPKHLPTDR